MDSDIIQRNCDRHALNSLDTEVAALVCQRLPRKEIVDCLFISERTVDKHTQNIFVKVDVTSRKELIIKFKAIGYQKKCFKISFISPDVN
ncbi:helix-turn-helix transcriptional regulator [Sphingobacterium spiritivorum]|uniref:helix-turn-helix transcriptional regulator n=1 Tax=Sphingobacterium spiritivorum TaxID=258 RepID=UPI003DA41789